MDLPVSSGTKLGRYEIRSKIGEGGMGEVYLAEDTQLGRRVAIKFLSPELVADERASKRLVKEARAAATLDHPNICSVYEVGEANGGSFIAMQYVEGETLDARIKRKPLELKESLTIAAQSADALAEAHSHGIIHRDIKPGNIMITSRGQAKVMDFGLARLITGKVDREAATQSLLTTPGTVIGTVPYMSPEQVRGEQIDARTDIFSFGVTLYEMLSGRQPFAAESAAATASAILTYEPPPLARFAPDTPDELQRIIRKCLEKDRERRYQTMRDVALDLETVRREHDAAQIATSRGREAPTSGTISALVPISARHRLFGSWRALTVTLTALVLVISVLVYALFFRKRVVPVASDIKSLAVLPLENLSGDPDQEYLADGVHEALITDLAKLSGFRRVVARTSVIRYRKSEKSLAQIARELGVDALITGSVLRSGNRVQVTAHLLNATTEEQIWGDRYERELRDVLSLQNEIVTAITRGVKLKLAPSDQQQLAGGRAVNQEAYEAYLKGQFYLNKFTPEGFERGLAYLHQAVEKDPTNPLVYSQLAVAYSLVGHDIIPNAFIEAKAAAHKALELDSNSAEAYEVLAEIKLYADWDDWQGAADNFQRALALNPNLAMGHRNYSWYLNLMGRSTEGIAEMKRAAEIDPMNPLFHEDLGWQYWDLSQSDEAIEEARKALELDPNFPYALLLLALVHGERGMYTEAIAAAQRLAQVEPDLRWGLAMSYARAGRKDQALRIVDEIKKEPSPWADWGLAQIYAVLGDREETLRWLEQGFQDRFSLMPWLRLRDAGLERPFKPFRDDLRYQDLLRRMNLME